MASLSGRSKRPTRQDPLGATWVSILWSSPGLFTIKKDGVNKKGKTVQRRRKPHH